MTRWIRRSLLLLLTLGIIAAGLGWWLLRGSLPTLEGQVRLPGLSAPVGMARDDRGVVTIDAANPTDAARAWGSCMRRNGISRWT